MTDGPAAIVYEEARRGLAGQEAALDALRGRAATILSAALVAVGLFGSHWTNDNLDVRRIVAGVAAVAVLALMAWFVAQIYGPMDFNVGVNMEDVTVALRDHPGAYDGEAVAMNFAVGMIDALHENQLDLARLGHDLVNVMCLLPLLIFLSALAVA